MVLIRNWSHWLSFTLYFALLFLGNIGIECLFEVFCNMFFENNLVSESAFHLLEDIFSAQEGVFPEEELKIFIQDNDLYHEDFFYGLAKYAFYRGTDISSKDDFFNYFSDKFDFHHPGTLFWRSYDALLNRGNISLFYVLWEKYVAIELKNYTTPFIYEALVIPEDPAFITVNELVHPHQQRLIKHFVHPKDNKKVIDDTEFDSLLESVIHHYSIILSFFRMKQLIFQRNVTFIDVKNLEDIISGEKIHIVGAYWEIRFLLTSAYWRLELGSILEVIELVNQIKALNSIAMNPLIDSHIFHIESIIAYNEKQYTEYNELVNSAYFLANEYQYNTQLFDILLTKAAFDKDNFNMVIEEIFSLTDDKSFPIVRANVYFLLANYHIENKNWNQAEKELLKASKILQQFTLYSKLYYQVIADFTFVLLNSHQLNEALESGMILIDNKVPLLIRIRGHYLLALALLLSDSVKESIEYLEEGLRTALEYNEKISLPWFYELLGLIYISQSDWITAQNYFELTYKAYFEVNNSEEGYRSKIISAFLLSIDANYGIAFSQLQGLLSLEIAQLDILEELIWSIQSVILMSKEHVAFENYNTIWHEQIVDSLDSTVKKNLFETRSLLINGKEILKEENIHYLNQINEIEDVSNFSVESALWLFFILKRQDFQHNVLPLIEKIVNPFLNSIKINFIIFKSFKYKSEIKNDYNDGLQISNDFLNQFSEKELMEMIFVINIFRLVEKNLPFNFLS